MTGAALLLSAALVAWPPERRGIARITAPPQLRLRSIGARLLLTTPVAAGAAAGAVVAALSTPLVAALAAGSAGLALRALRRRQRSAAADAGVLAMAEALGVLAAELDAGRSLTAATDAAVAACPEQSVGAALAAALRLEGEPPPGTPPVGEWEQVRSAVRLSARTGCSLAAVLRALEEDLRVRHRQLHGLRSATAGSRASAVVLAGLPLLGLAMGSGIGAHPWAVLTTTGPGQVLLTVGVLLEWAGVAWTGRLTRRAAPRLGPSCRGAP